MTANSTITNCGKNHL